MQNITRKHFIRLLPALAIALLAACSSTPDNSSDLASVDATGTSGVPKLSAAAMAKLRDPNSPLSKRSVYFNYDQYDVKSEYNSQLQAHAKFIASEPNARVLVQGNTDDRGSREYNLALGQRRANSARDVLVLENTPMDYLDFASPREGLAGKLGIDATTKIGSETTREWGRVMTLDPAHATRAADLLARHLGGVK